MSGDFPRQGVLDTDIMILSRWIDPGQLPDEKAISAITLPELSAARHEVRRKSEQDLYDEHSERVRRLEILQRAERLQPFTANPMTSPAWPTWRRSYRSPDRQSRTNDHPRGSSSLAGSSHTAETNDEKSSLRVRIAPRTGLEPAALLLRSLRGSPSNLRQRSSARSWRFRECRASAAVS
jgi:hypothetical protein